MLLRLFAMSGSVRRPNRLVLARTRVELCIREADWDVVVTFTVIGAADLDCSDKVLGLIEHAACCGAPVHARLTEPVIPDAAETDKL